MYDLVILEGRAAPGGVDRQKHCPRAIFTPEQITEIERAWEAGATIAELAASVGLSAGSFSEHRRYGQLRHLPNRQGRGGGYRAPSYHAADPTPEQIRERAAAIRRTWVGYEHGDSGPPGIRCVRSTDLGLDR